MIGCICPSNISGIEKTRYILYTVKKFNCRTNTKISVLDFLNERYFFVSRFTTKNKICLKNILLYINFIIYGFKLCKSNSHNVCVLLALLLCLGIDSYEDGQRQPNT